MDSSVKDQSFKEMSKCYELMKGIEKDTYT